MQTSKTRNGPSDAPQRTSPRTPRSSRVAKTGGNETDSTGVTPTRTPTERSPKVTERRSPRSPITEKKRPSRLSESESKVSQLQDELKKVKEQLSLSEARRHHTQQEAEEAKKQEQAAISKLEDLQRQLDESSAAEQSHLQELRKISQERDRAWESELEAVQKQQSADTTALSSAMSEIQRLKQQLEATAQSDAARAKQCEYAESEIEGLKQDMEIRLATIEGLKVNVGESDKAAAEANCMATETKQQLEAAKATIDSLVAEGVRMQECLRLKDMELNESKALIASLEEDLKNAQAEGHESLKKAQDTGNIGDSFGNPEPEALKKVLTTSDANGGCESSDPEIEHLRTALEVAEIRYQEVQTRMTIETKTAYQMLENVKAECACRVCDLEHELKKNNDELMEAKAACVSIVQQDLHKPDAMSDMQPELEAKLMKSITDIAELKASLMDKENALQSMAEENETLKSEVGKMNAELQHKYEAAVAELELAKAAEQDVRMRLGFVTEEADKSSRRAARASEQLDAAQASSAEMEAELRRLRVQSDQWRKAAEAAAAALTGAGGVDNNNNSKTVERTGSLDPEYNSLGGKLMSSPFLDEVDGESPKRRNSSGVLRRMSGLWKKSPK
ncbi:interactor of constitutive active ROPs 2, chloroplastic-like [Phragmites australis]|uniref:interactor of constitutive active ROPs 2, chloroplastic-like n=1 Tax=Phragmites australis TaxID=29695 RepID=UPI002D7A1F4A|nr:interactor of constitutive active ROPs 2, chloroplastic-like [Phragmites australis]XP_062230603.1 interactor of constitutive active ROPs 2, chloroplastic-like [Phragmites australis]XP_062230604.1 interactor of constitutive active ROPs 2, chloroplastic-like [Phragmites australis]XP_062230605.1 interactor of constitutive active ROPs 2, chloroplastic-like [Phragmites australis]XP_062230606.1 interactor of constitutive active ROPs 2, chloroplastic-like [Phragmites australis]XP_062230607.1 inter